MIWLRRNRRDTPRATAGAPEKDKDVEAESIIEA
jgi:hypothetical protein